MERLTLGRDREGRVVFSSRTRGGTLVPPPHTIFLDQNWSPLGRDAVIVRFTKRRKSSVWEWDPRRNRGGEREKVREEGSAHFFLSLILSLPPPPPPPRLRLLYTLAKPHLPEGPDLSLVWDASPLPFSTFSKSCLLLLLFWLKWLSIRVHFFPGHIFDVRMGCDVTSYRGLNGLSIVG